MTIYIVLIFTLVIVLGYPIVKFADIQFASNPRSVLALILLFLAAVLLLWRWGYLRHVSSRTRKKILSAMEGKNSQTTHRDVPKD